MVLAQKKDNKDKIYSIHEPKVEFNSKGCTPNSFKPSGASLSTIWPRYAIFSSNCPPTPGALCPTAFGTPPNRAPCNNTAPANALTC